MFEVKVNEKPWALAETLTTEGQVIVTFKDECTLPGASVILNWTPEQEAKINHMDLARKVAKAVRTVIELEVQ